MRHGHVSFDQGLFFQRPPALFSPTLKYSEIADAVLRPIGGCAGIEYDLSR
jgi:hypothetical protein